MRMLNKHYIRPNPAKAFCHGWDIQPRAFLWCFKYSVTLDWAKTKLCDSNKNDSFELRVISKGWNILRKGRLLVDSRRLSILIVKNYH